MVPPTVFDSLPQTERFSVKPWMRFCNKVLTKLHSPVELYRRFDHREDMLSLQQIANFELLISNLLERNVAGDFVEFGCYTGNTTAVFAKLIEQYDPDRTLHVFDRFDIELGQKRGIREIFDERMKPFGNNHVVHAGDLLSTVPKDLPEQIAFLHIDLGTGGGYDSHAKLMAHALEHAYPRMVSNGIMVFMDYHSPGVTVNGNDSNPGVRKAVDAFFKDKAENIRILFGGACSHAYSVKK